MSNFPSDIAQFHVLYYPYRFKTGIELLKKAAVYFDKIALVPDFATGQYNLFRDEALFDEDSPDESLQKILKLRSSETQFISQADVLIKEGVCYVPDLQIMTHKERLPIAWESLTNSRIIDFDHTVAQILHEFVNKTSTKRLYQYYGFPLKHVYRSEELLLGLLAVINGLNIPYCTDDGLIHDLMKRVYYALISSKLNYGPIQNLKSKLDIKRNLVAFDIITQNLPNLELMSFEDVLQTREMLKNQLERFRIEMGKLSTKIKSEPWEIGFEEEIDNVVKAEVNPAIADLRKELELSDKKFFQRIFKGAKSYKTFLTITVSVFAGVSLPTALAITAGLIISEAAFDTHIEKEEIKQNGLSYLLRF